MTLVVEDGTGRADAESYASVAQADAYCVKRGYTSWDALDNTDAKEPALRKATDYMRRYNWKGQRCNATQALDWPRFGVTCDGFDLDATTLPPELVNACIELAYRASTAELAPDEERRQTTSETIGPLSFSYAPGPQAGSTFRAVDVLLQRLVRGSNSISLVRG